MPTPNWREESVSVAGIDVHFYRGGEGPPWCSYTVATPIPAGCSITRLWPSSLASTPQPSGLRTHPGLAWIATIADMALFYLWFLDAVGLARTHLVGHDIGGWLAADMATACPHVIDRLVLADAMGLKPQHSEIRDIFLITPDEYGPVLFRHHTGAGMAAVARSPTHLRSRGPCRGGAGDAGALVLEAIHARTPPALPLAAHYTDDADRLGP